MALRRLVEGPELLDAAPRQVDGEALNRVDEIRLHERLFRAQKTFYWFLLLERPGDELIEVPHVVEEARLGEAVREVSLDNCATASHVGFKSQQCWRE